MTWIPLYVIVFAFLLYKYKWRGLWIAVFAIGSIGLADGISSHIFKPLFARIRPCNLPELADNINIVLSYCSGGFSFTSSHAANHFALASFFGFFFYKNIKWLWMTTFFWASLICFAQVYVGVHFPTDVLVGGLLGILIGFVCNILGKKQ
ncbi:MAG: phosphatase PAP2 family protein [Chitinophagales bacterium]